MTDLGNGLFAISIPKESEKLLLDSYGTIFYRIGKKLKVINTRKENHQILGTVTASDISFDVEPYVQKRTLGYWLDYNKPNTRHDYMCDTPKDSFRSLLSSKGLYFENPYGETEPNITHIGKSNYTSNVDLVIKWQQAQNNLIEKLVIIKKV